MIRVLVNPTAGGRTGHGRSEEIAAAFASAGAAAAAVEVIEVGDGDDLARVARAAARDAGVVVAAGGDGTVNGVAAAIAGTGAALGVIPAGTLNHFARDMQLPAALDNAAATIAAGRRVRVDLGEVNGRIFLNNSSIGVYPNAVAIREQLRRAGRSKWMAMAIAIWRVLRTYRGVHVELDVDGTRIPARTPFVFIGNNEYIVEGLKIGARERLDSGRLFVYLAPRVTTRQLPMLLVRALVGRARLDRAYEVIATTELTIGVPRARRWGAAPPTHMSVSLDGETTTLPMPLRYRARPAALEVIA